MVLQRERAQLLHRATLDAKTNMAKALAQDFTQQDDNVQTNHVLWSDPTTMPIPRVTLQPGLRSKETTQTGHEQGRCW